MHKKIKLIFFALFFATLFNSLHAHQLQMKPISAQATRTVIDELSMEYGYCGDLESTVGWNSAGLIRAVIEIPAEIAIKYKGAKISGVLTGLGNDAGFDAKIIILDSLEDEKVAYSQDVVFIADQWNETTLTEPYVLDGEKFYVGYELAVSNANTYPVGIDNEEAIPYGDLCAMYDTETEKWDWEHLADFNFGNNCIKVILSGENLPKHDLALTNVKVPDYIHTGKSFSIVGTVKNLAALDIETFEISYQIDDAEPLVSTIDINVAKSSMAEFQLDNLVINEVGTHDIRLEIVSVENNPDEDVSNNIQNKTVHGVPDIASRKVLIEEFSTAQCVNCPRVHEIMKAITESRNDIALVVHHAGYGQDNYTIPASRSYLSFYAGSTYAPAMMIDRRNLSEQGAQGYMGEAQGPVFSISSQTEVEDFVSYCLEQPALVSVNIEDSYNAETRELTVRVYGETIIDLPQTPYINIFLTESGMINYQAGGGNDYIHNHAIRATMTETWGDELSVADNKYDVTYTAMLDSKWLPENMNIIAFVSDYDRQDVNNCVVYNSEWKATEYSSGIPGIVNNKCNVWVANGNIYISGEYATAEIYSLDGSLVKCVNKTHCIEMENKGVYFIKVNNSVFKTIVR